MSEDQDPVTKTEDPTPNRLSESEKKGQVAKSQEVNHWFMISAATLLFVLITPTLVTAVRVASTRFLESPHAIATDPGHLIVVLTNLLRELSVVMALIFLALVVAAIAANMVQHRLLLSGERMRPKLSKLSPMKGLKRIFSLRSLVEFFKSLLKIIIIAAVVAFLVWPDRGFLPQLMTIPVVEQLAIIEHEALVMLAAVVAIMALVGGADLMYQKYEHIKGLRMSKQEVKDEQKQAEGDPIIKARIRSLRMERARKRMMAAVPRADVVVTNPTHYAVALEYKSETMTAPRLLAKGVDSVAKKIREVAAEHEVPVVENPPVARALYATVELDQEIPVEHYKAVAEIIGYMMRLKAKAGSHRNGVG